MADDLELPEYETYDDLVNCGFWQSALKDLNTHLVHALIEKGHAPELNGNLFYAHKDADFQNKRPAPRLEDKRRNLFKLAKRSTHMFEVGVNGGHSLFLALCANPGLNVTGVDICKQVEPSWARVDVYVPAAFDWLTRKFQGRCEFIAGNSLVELPRYTDENPDQTIDLLHLDGAKDTHLQEFLAVRPVMRERAFVLHDDANTKPVRLCMRQILRLGMAEKAEPEKLGLIETGAQKLLVVT